MINADLKYYMYTITCTVNDKIYIGITKSFKERVINHKKELRRGIHRNSNLQYDYNIYGVDFFEYDIICEYTSKIEALRQEKYYTDYVLCLNKNICYNIFSGGTPFFNYRFNFSKIPKSKEAIEKIRAANLGKTISDETRAKITGANCKKSRKIINTVTNKKYGCVQEVSNETGYSVTYIRSMINGERPDKLSLKWL